MEEINLKDLIHYFWSKIFYILFITLGLVALVVSYALFFRVPIYESSASIILTGFSDAKDDAKINNTDLTINQKLLATYQEITKSRKVLTRVIEDLNLEYTVSELASHVKVTGKTDTEIIVITVSDRDSWLAYKITDRIAEVFSEEVKSIYNVSNVSVLDSPILNTIPSNMGISKITFLSLVGGLVLAFLVVFIIYYFDTTIKNASQIEEKIDVPILGSIPDYNSKKKKKEKRGSKNEG